MPHPPLPPRVAPPPDNATMNLSYRCSAAQADVVADARKKEQAEKEAARKAKEAAAVFPRRPFDPPSPVNQSDKMFAPTCAKGKLEFEDPWYECAALN